MLRLQSDIFTSAMQSFDSYFSANQTGKIRIIAVRCDQLSHLCWNIITSNGIIMSIHRQMQNNRPPSILSNPNFTFTLCEISHCPPLKTKADAKRCSDDNTPTQSVLYYLCSQVDSCTTERHDKYHRYDTGCCRGSTEWRRCLRRRLTDKCSCNRRPGPCSCRHYDTAVTNTD